MSLTDVDLAMGVFECFGPEFGGGMSNHGPMVVEALHALGHDGLIPAWVDVYAPRLEDGQGGAPISPSGWTDALGNGAYGDWQATFAVEVLSLIHI